MEHDSIPHSKPVRIAGKVAYVYFILGIFMAGITALLIFTGVVPLTSGNWSNLGDIIASIFAILFISLFFYLIVELFHVLSRILVALIEIKELLREREGGKHTNAE